MVALAVACVTAVVCVVKQRQNGPPQDFAMFWTAARILLDGGDPYALIRPGGQWNWDSGYLYPLPAALAVVPLAGLPVAIAALVFSSFGMAVLAYVLLRDYPHRWPVLMSAPALLAVTAGQWSPWIVAAALTPAMAWAAAIKPTLGAAAFVHRPSWRWLWVAAAVVLLSLLVMRTWPAKWLYNVRTAQSPTGYPIPVMVPGGFLALLALLRWKRPEARFLAVMACAPQKMLLYDQLALCLLARSRLEAMLMAHWSYLVLAVGYFMRNRAGADLPADTFLAYVITWGYYVPAAILLLRRPNDAVSPTPV